MSKKPLVSIVLPTYNGAKYIVQSIESCLTQTYDNIELIIVNDASTDNVQEVIDKYIKEDKRVFCITHEENRKLPAALNSGFSIARGKYLTWTSDDNFYHKEAIQHMVDFMDTRNNIDIVYCDISIIDNTNMVISEVIVEEPKNLIYHNCVGACFLYKRSVHDTLKGYNTEVFLLEDYDFWLRAFKCFTMQPLHKNLYYYRNHSFSLTQQNPYKISLGSILTINEHIGQLSHVCNKDKGNAYRLLAERSRDMGKYYLVLKFIFKALRLDWCNSFFHGIKLLFSISVILLKTGLKCIIK